MVADYCTVSQAKEMLGGQWGADASLGTGSSRDQVLGALVTRCSRMFDRETRKPTNFWATQAGITRYYSGHGRQLLDIDDFDAVTGVSMSTRQDRSDAITLTLTDTSSTANYVVKYPISGPPYSQLFLLRGWLPDPFNIGNVTVTGDVSTPADITHAVAVWAAYEWKAKDAGWADVAQRPDGPGLLYVRGIPPETKRIVDYYRSTERGPKLGVPDVGGTERLSKWIGWRTVGSG